MTQGKRQSLTPSDEDRRAGISGEGSSPKRPGCASSRSAAEQASWVQETRLDSSGGEGRKGGARPWQGVPGSGLGSSWMEHHCPARAHTP